MHLEVVVFSGVHGEQIFLLYVSMHVKNHFLPPPLEMAFEDFDRVGISIEKQGSSHIP